jgi:dTMP kinase
MLIAFEGIDGSGKTSAARRVAAALVEYGVAAVLIEKKNPCSADPYVASHMTALRRLIWDHEPDDPIHLLGEKHWLYLMASYFACLNNSCIQPYIRTENVVVVDNWHYKFLARFLEKDAALSSEAAWLFEQLQKPDHIFLLDLDPVEAARRKRTFTTCEAGNLAGLQGRNTQNFVAYQMRIRDRLLMLGRELGWTRIEADRSLDTITRDIVSSLDGLLPKM